MSTTKKKPAKKAAVKKVAAKKSPAKKVAAKKDEKGKKLAELTFTVHENGIEVSGEASVKTMIIMHKTLIGMIQEAQMDGLKEAFSQAYKRPTAKKK